MTEAQSPWEALGISKATYYRKRKAETVSPKVSKSQKVSPNATAISTVEKPRKVIGRPFQPGNNANPKGRPKGSRNKLTESFLAAMCADFEANGVEAIAAARTSDPSRYIASIAGLVPKQVEIGEAGAFADMSDAELAAFIAETDAQLQHFDGAGRLH